jgi:hypothetical protein
MPDAHNASPGCALRTYRFSCFFFNSFCQCYCSFKRQPGRFGECCSNFVRVRKMFKIYVDTGALRGAAGMEPDRTFPSGSVTLQFPLPHVGVAAPSGVDIISFPPHLLTDNDPVACPSGEVITQSLVHTPPLSLLAETDPDKRASSAFHSTDPLRPTFASPLALI